MSYMFNVRSAHALGPQPFERRAPCMPLVCAATTPQALPPPGSYRLPPASHALPSTRQYASAFNQPLSFDTSSVNDMRYMFRVRSARALGPQALSRAPCMPTLPPSTLSPASRHAHLAPPIIYTPPFRLPQYANSLSAPNKLLIRCAWVGTAAFASAGFGSGWAPGSCA